MSYFTYSSFVFKEEPPRTINVTGQNYLIGRFQDEKGHWVYRVRKLNAPPQYVDLGRSKTEEELRESLLVKGVNPCQIEELRLCEWLVKHGLMREMKDTHKGS